MEKRKWTSQQKLTIVLEGLSGQIEISKLCAKYQIAPDLSTISGATNCSSSGNQLLKQKTSPRKNSTWNRKTKSSSGSSAI